MTGPNLKSKSYRLEFFVFRLAFQRMNLGSFFGIKIDDDDVETAGGLLTKALGRIPIVGSCAQAYGVTMSADRFEGRRKLLQTIIASRVETEEDEPK